MSKKKTGPFYNVPQTDATQCPIVVSSGPQAPRCTMCLTPAFWHYPIALLWRNMSSISSNNKDTINVSKSGDMRTFIIKI
jgi:hypothetical protein